MKISSLSIIELLNTKLFEFPDLVNLLEKKDHRFLTSFENWMKETETIMKDHRIPECSLIAGYRSKVLTPVFSERQKRSTKKRQLQLASEVMYDAQNTVLTVMKPHEVKVNEAKDLLIHILSILKQSEGLKYTCKTSFQAFITQIWELCSKHEQLKPGTVKILSLISQSDALRLIAEEVNPHEWE